MNSEQIRGPKGGVNHFEKQRYTSGALVEKKGEHPLPGRQDLEEKLVGVAEGTAGSLVVQRLNFKAGRRSEGAEGPWGESLLRRDG